MKDDDAVESTPPPLPAAGARKGADDMSDDDDAGPRTLVAPAPRSKHQEEEEAALRVLSDDRRDATIASEYLTGQVADNPEFAEAAEVAFMAEEDKDAPVESEAARSGSDSDEVTLGAAEAAGDPDGEPVVDTASGRAALNAIRKVFPELDSEELRDFAKEFGVLQKEAVELADKKDAAGRVAADKRARDALRSGRNSGKARGTEGGRDPVPTDSAPGFPLEAPISDDEQDDDVLPDAPPNPAPFDPAPLTVPPPPLLVLSREKEKEFGPLGRPAAQKMYHELTVVLGYAWVPVSEKINKLSKREVMSGAATKNDIASEISWGN